MPDRGRGLAQPSCGVGVVRSSSKGKSHSAPAVRLLGLCPGPPLFICGKKNIFFHKPRHFFINSKWGNEKIKKIFFMRSRPRLIDWRTDSSCTPSASAISLMLFPRMMWASILRPWDLPVKEFECVPQTG